MTNGLSISGLSMFAMEKSKDSLSKHYDSRTDRVFTPVDELRADAAMTDELQKQFHDVDELIANRENYDDWPIDPKKRVFRKKYIKDGKLVECSHGKKGPHFKSTIEQIAIEGHRKHNGKYKYSIQEYFNNRTKIQIHCLHCEKEFSQIPSDHLRGIGCPKCADKQNADRRRYTLDDIRKKSIEVHKGKYTIPEQKYKNNRTSIRIICPDHGEFLQRPCSHARGEGCPQCAYQQNGDRCRYTLDVVRKKSNEVHNGKYTIPDQEYVNKDTPIEIICPIHSSFWQRPGDHTTNCIGCPKCAIEQNADRRRHTLDDIRKKSIEVHGEKYTIPDQEYKNSNIPIKIKCPDHGEFLQSSGHHLYGHGCPLCKNKTEGKLYMFLKSKLPEHSIEQQKKYDWCKNPETGWYLRFDFVVYENIIIELDGDQHIKQVRNWKCPEEQQERDMYKMEQAINNGKHVIRILQRDVWNDRNDWEEKLIQAITELKDTTDTTIRCIGDCATYKEYAIETDES